MSLKSIMYMSLVLGGGLPLIKYNDNDRKYQSLRYNLVNKPKRNMNNNWVDIDSVVFDDKIIAMRVDTRDFHIITNNHQKTVNNLDRLIQLNSNNTDKCIFTIEEIEKYLKDLYKKSGGKSEWRYLSFIGKGKNVSQNWNLKYLSIYKTIYGYLIYNQDESRVLFEYELLSEINEELLNLC